MYCQGIEREGVRWRVLNTVGKPKKRSKRRQPPAPEQAPPAQSPGTAPRVSGERGRGGSDLRQGGAGDRKQAGRRSGRGSWMQTHGRDLRFLGIFAILMGIYYLATTTSAMSDPDHGFFEWYLLQNAKASAGIVHLFGYDDMERRGKSLISSRGSITVERGCDAVEPSALFVSAVMASPVPFLSRLTAAVAGTVLLMLLNLFRIITLFLCAVHWKKAFDIMHLDVWQTLFIVLAILLWAVWAAWATKRRPRQANARA